MLEVLILVTIVTCSLIAYNVGVYSMRKKYRQGIIPILEETIADLKDANSRLSLDIRNLRNQNELNKINNLVVSRIIDISNERDISYTEAQKVFNKRQLKHKAELEALKEERIKERSNTRRRESTSRYNNSSSNSSSSFSNDFNSSSYSDTSSSSSSDYSGGGGSFGGGGSGSDW